RLPEPEKITSSMPDARIALYELSPITQRMASTRLDLPQPLGPTMPVRPGSITSVVSSQKDLKPTSLRRENFMGSRRVQRVCEGEGFSPGGCVKTPPHPALRATFAHEGRRDVRARGSYCAGAAAGSGATKSAGTSGSISAASCSSVLSPVSVLPLT